MPQPLGRLACCLPPALAGSTKREPIVVGKPAEFMLENIAHKFNLRREQVGCLASTWHRHQRVFASLPTQAAHSLAASGLGLQLRDAGARTPPCAV